jgi:peroxiredoxin
MRQKQQPQPASASRAPCARPMRIAALALLAGMALASAAQAITQLRRSDEAPAIALQDRLGREVTTAGLRGRVVLVIFGELYHDKTREACAAADTVLQDPRFSGQPITTLLVTARQGEDDPKHQLPMRLKATILRDPDRRAFGAYQVAVMPSVVVIDPQGRVIHAMAGMIPRFSDLLTDSLLHGVGKLSAENLDRSVAVQPATRPGDVDMRAERLALLARQLARRGLDEMATEKYLEALAINAGYVPAQLELGMLQLKHRRLAEAERQFRTVLEADPGSLQATLGLAFVQTLRGGSELDEAETAVRAILARNMAQPRAHYLLGLIQEQRKKPEDAAASFKKAAQLLLDRAEQE